MTHTETTITQAYTSTGLQLVDSTSLVSDLVTDLQQEMILFVIGPYEGVYLSLYRNGRQLVYWRTTEQLSYKQLCALPHQQQTLAYPETSVGQAKTIRTLVLETFFVLKVAEASCPNKVKPSGAVALTTVREINRALRAHFARTGGRVRCSREGSTEVIQVHHAKHPRGGSLQVAGSNGHWFTPAEVWIEPEKQQISA